MRKAFIDALLAAMDRKEIRCRDLSEISGLTRQTISTIRGNKQAVSLEQAVTLARILEMSLDEIYELGAYSGAEAKARRTLVHDCAMRINECLQISIAQVQRLLVRQPRSDDEQASA